MAGVTNVKTVRFKSENQMGYGDDLYAHDVGQILRFTGITLPGLYRVYFSRFPEGEGVIRLGDENGVTVPSECLTYPGPLYVWIVLTHAEKDKTTTYKALLQVLARSDVPDVPDEESGSVITDAINAMNDVMGRVERAEDVLNRAETVVSGIESYPSVTYYECAQLRKVSTVVPVADIDNPLYPSPGLSSQYADGVGLVIPLQSGYTPKENDLFMIKATDDILLPERTNNRKYSALYISFLIVEHTDDGGIQQHEEPRLIYNIPYNYPTGTRMFDKGRAYIFRYRPHTVSDPYQQDTSYGTGFDVLNYMVGVKEAVETAKEVMDEAVSLVTEKAVRYDERQTLTEEQQVMARSNIHAAMLDVNGRVPASQLPSYVDDVLEGYADPQQDPITAFYRVRMGEVGNYSYSEPYTPEAGKIYVDMEYRKTYRWTGSGYAVIGVDLVLGETSSTAFPGDRGVALEQASATVLDAAENISGQVAAAQGYAEEAYGYAADVEAAKDSALDNIDNKVGDATDAINSTVSTAQTTINNTVNSSILTMNQKVVSAQQAETNARTYAEQAEAARDEALDMSGYMAFEIDDEGYLVYMRNKNVDVDFTVDNDGYLVMESGA